jgi:hypothetical protein
MTEPTEPSLAWARQISAASAATSGCRYTDASQTLIFLDWDDTIFPTSALFPNGFRQRCPQGWKDMDFTEEEENALGKWRDALFEYLSAACSLSKRVAILTNSCRPWVEDCIALFAPDVQQLLDDSTNALRIVYARDTLPKRLQTRGSFAVEPTQEFEARLMKIKYNAMKAETQEFYSQYPDQTWKNIVSFGDAAYEHDAIQDVAFRRTASGKGLERENIRVKAWITPVEPSLSDLVQCLRLATILLPATVWYDGDIDLDMNGPTPLQVIADALEVPEVDSQKRRDSIVSEELDELDEVMQAHPSFVLSPKASHTVASFEIEPFGA